MLALSKMTNTWAALNNWTTSNIALSTAIVVFSTFQRLTYPGDVYTTLEMGLFRAAVWTNWML